MEPASTRDIIVIGASMGGVEALSHLASALPPHLPASVLVVQHVSAESPALLADILSDAGPLPATTAADRTPLERGRIYVAPPDRHLLLTAEGLRVVFGPRENRVRPAIDPLFRTAAVNYRSRVIGVILTGLLGDGAAGLQAVHRCGGTAVVQALDDAAHADMPSRALAAAGEARQSTLGEMGALLTSLSSERAPDPPPVPDVLRMEALLTERAMKSDDWEDVPSVTTDYTCPECNGALRMIDDEGVPRFRCRVGHAFSLESMVDAKDAAVEEALWIALQTLQERAQMYEAMVAEDQQRGRFGSSAATQARAREARMHAERLREFVIRLAV